MTKRYQFSRSEYVKRVIVGLALVFALGSILAAQETKHEVTVQGSGFFTKESTGLGITDKPTYSGGLVVGYRYNLNRWLGIEGDYDYFSNAQRYSSGGAGTAVKTNVNALTGTAVIKIPTSFMLKPYALVGGGVMIFDPRDNASLDSQTRGTFVYGGGADYSLTKRIALRGEYRGFVYRTPDFQLSSIKTDKFTHSAVPSAGLVFKF
jgi:outer membrane immunogenic protein